MPMLTTLRIRFPVWPFQAPLRTRSAKSAIRVQHFMDLRHDVLAIHQNAGIFGRPQRHVQHRALFRDVDFVAPEHGVDPLPQSGLGCEFEEQFQGLVGDAVFRVIQVKAHSLQVIRSPRFGSCANKSRRCKLARLFEVCRQSAPGFALGQRLNLNWQSLHNAILFCCLIS